MTAVAPWGENAEDAFDQGLVELGLGDVRLIQAQGAMLPLGFGVAMPRPLPMGSLVECHLQRPMLGTVHPHLLVWLGRPV